MNIDLEKKLVAKYPDIFQDVDKSPGQSCMAFGIECGDGWYKLIDELCMKITEHVRCNNMEPVVASQIKEKFGGLRFYYFGGDDFISDSVDDAEERSFKICEVCGEPGIIEKAGWLRCLCDKCRKAGRSEKTTKENISSKGT